MAVVEVPQLLQDVVIVAGAIPAVMRRPQDAAFSIGSTIVRVAGDLVLLVALALVMTALLT